MPKFTAYLLDPAAATIGPVEIQTAIALETFYRLIGCNLIDRLWMTPIWPMSMTKALPNAQPACGRSRTATCLRLQAAPSSSPTTARAGGDTTPTVPIQIWAERFRIFRPVIVPDLVTLTPVAPGGPGGTIVSATRIGGLRLALDRPDLSVTGEEAS